MLATICDSRCYLDSSTPTSRTTALRRTQVFGQIVVTSASMLLGHSGWLQHNGSIAPNYCDTTLDARQASHICMHQAAACAAA
jgi:hypothetical protein